MMLMMVVMLMVMVMRMVMRSVTMMVMVKTDDMMVMKSMKVEILRH